MALGLTALLCLHAIAQPGASAARRVIHFDPTYDTYYCADLPEVIPYFERRGFEVLDTAALVRWMQERVAAGGSSGTVVLHISGVVPKALAEPWNKACLLYRYCHDGGRFVTAAGNPLSHFQGETDIGVLRQTGNYKTPQHLIINAFGITPVYGLSGKGRELTEAGRQWGLSDGNWLKYLVAGEPPEDLTQILVRSQDGQAANVWLKTVNPKHLNSGLLGLAVFVSPVEWILSEIYKLCVFERAPVASVPEVDWQQREHAPAVSIEVSMKPGTEERRAYVRGEPIPLRVRVGGPEYRGQPVTVRLHDGDQVLWQEECKEATNGDLTATATLATAGLRADEYTLRVEVTDGPSATERLWICAERPRNGFPMYLLKSRKQNQYREELATQWLGDHYLNVNLYDVHRCHTPEQRLHLAQYLDMLLRYGIRANATLSALPLYADPERKDEWLIGPDGEPRKHGLKTAISWHGILANHSDEMRDKYRTQAELMRDLASPTFRPFFYINDDGSMAGHWDFAESTLADLQKERGTPPDQIVPVKPQDLSGPAGEPLPKHVPPPGIVPDEHPWLQYMRQHSGNYAKINALAMEGIQAGWPESVAGDIACMAGSMFIERGIYPPLCNTPLNSATFYMYKFRPQYYTFSAEAMRMGNRGKPSGFVISSSHTNWGRVFQRSVTCHVLAENPCSLGFYSLDDTPMPSLHERVEEQYDELRQIGARMSPLAPFLEQATAPRKRSALFIGFAQNCFFPEDRELQYAAFCNLLRAGADIELVCSEEVLAGDAAKYEAIVLNGIRWMQANVQTALAEHARRGGKVLCDPATAVEIEGAVRLDGSPSEAGGDCGHADRIAFCRTLVGRHLPAQAPVSPVDGDTVVRLLQMDERPLAWVLAVESQDELREMSRAKSEDWTHGMHQFLTAQEAAHHVVRKAVRVADGYHVYDLWSHREVPLTDGGDGSKHGTVELQYLGGTVLGLYTDRIGAIRLDKPRVEVRRGGSVSIACALQTAASKVFTGRVPAEVTVHYPGGEEAWEYGANTVFADGALSVKLNIARNAPVGTWRVTVRDLCSGQGTECTVEVSG